MRKMYYLEVEKYVSKDDEKGLDELYELKDKYFGEYDLGEDKIGHIWEDNGIFRVFYDDDEEDRVIVYVIR